jgi:anti-anti-sigma factor
MAFNATLEMDNGTAKIKLSGELDASVAPAFRETIEQAAAQSATRLVLLMHELEYMSSAGLRVLVFAKQKMSASVDIYVVGAQEYVVNTLEKVGLDNSLIIQEAYAPLQAS